MSLDILLDRSDRIYRPGDKVTGSVRVTTKGGLTHSSLTIQMLGTVTLQFSTRNVGLYEAFHNSLRPITIVDYPVTIEKSGKIVDTKEYPFEFVLKPLEEQEFYETYHGVYVNIIYTLKAELFERKLIIGRTLMKLLEFIVEKPITPEKVTLVQEKFIISPENTEISKRLKDFPEFEVEGFLKGVKCSLSQPLEGQIIVKHCSEPIKCIELKLIRTETCGCSDGYSKEDTEIQNIQLTDGDVVPGLKVPIYMIFPRLFTCPTVAARTFKVDFEVNIALMFPDGRQVSKKFPLILVR